MPQVASIGGLGLPFQPETLVRLPFLLYSLQTTSPLNCAEVFALNPIRLCLLFALLAVFVVPARAQKEDWQPITQHDLEMKQVPGNPGADAIQLYYADFINDQEQTEFFYQSH